MAPSATTTRSVQGAAEEVGAAAHRGKSMRDRRVPTIDGRRTRRLRRGRRRPPEGGFVSRAAVVPPLRDPVVVAAFEGWNDAGEAASGARAPARKSGRPAGRRARPRGLLRLPGQPADGRARRGRAAARITWPTTRLSGRPRRRAARDVVLVRGIEPSMRWRAFVAEVLEARAGARRRAARDARRAARRRPAHPARSRSPAPARTRPARPARRRAVAATRARPASSACCRTRPARPASRPSRSGPRCRTTPAQPPSPEGHAGAAAPLEELLDITCRSATCPRRRAPGSAASTSWPRGQRGRGLRPVARGGQGHRRPARGQRRGDRARVRALPAPPRRRPRRATRRRRSSG